jgi:hypothetical protein
LSRKVLSDIECIPRVLQPGWSVHRNVNAPWPGDWTGAILDAVRGIGADVAGEFFRTLATEGNVEARMAAAVALAEGAASEKAKNLAALKVLMGDEKAWVRVPAAVSLSVLDYEPARQQVVEWLESPPRHEKFWALQQFARVKDAAKLEFARKALDAIAVDPAAGSGPRGEAKAVLTRMDDAGER